MTPAAFRKLALSLEGAMEGAHGGHPDFRAGGKVFASLGYPGAEWGMVKLAPRAAADAGLGRTRDVRSREGHLGPARRHQRAVGRSGCADDAECAHHGVAERDRAQGKET
jgi:hypothetical protein